MLLSTYLKQNADADMSYLLNNIMIACKDIAFRLDQGALAGILGAAGTENIQGEDQKALDVISNDLLKDTLLASGVVRGIASEEEDLPVAGSADGKFLVLFDPLDGSSNIDVNLSVGTIFSVLLAADGADGGAEATYLQAGRKQVAAGYVLYGPSTLLVMTLGKGVDVFTLDTKIGEFVLTREQIKVPETTKEFAINMSVQRFWEAPMQSYIADCIAGETSPLGKRYNMRWVASMVAEVHRILTRGGIFMYPWDNREVGKAGKLRLMYEGNPMSFLIEQAGGLSTTPRENIMDLNPEKIHQRCGVVLGSKQEVETVKKYYGA
jgi:fructose-1,6-bisphosphatase I